jgi:hypothetical protein
MTQKWIISCLALITLIVSAGAQVDSQWRGPKRDGVYSGESLIKIWPQAGPKLIWSAGGLGEGYSSPAVTNNRVYVTGMIRGSGFLWAFDAGGKKIWTLGYGREWDEGHPGARSTPTVVGNRIYFMSGYGVVHCVDTRGKKVWSIDLMEKHSARNLRWGMTESLLVDGEKVFATPGAVNAMIMAFSRHTGQVIWKIRGNGQKSAYCSPVIVKHGLRRLLLTMTGESVVGIDADSGKFLWQAPHKTRHDINPNTPLYHQGSILTVSGYGTTGTKQFKLSRDGKQITLVWQQKTLDSQMGAAVLAGGYIYGSGHRKSGWHCLDWLSGKVRYTDKELGRKGNIIYADGMLYCYDENGSMGLVKPNPRRFQVISSFKITRGSGPHWAHPVIKKGRLYVRHGDVILVYDINR